MPSDFDVIVVGAGPSGSAASISLARKRTRVLLVEKGKAPGEKNTSGGILYGDFPGEWGMSTLAPGYEQSAPLERRIIAHETVVLDEPDLARGKSRYYRLTKSSLPARLGIFSSNYETGHDYSVLRKRFDGWIADVAVKEGATLSTETTATGLLIEGGAVAGVSTPHEDIRAKLVIDASGVTSTLVQEAGLRGKLTPRQLYHGIKKVYELDQASIEKRFRVRPGEGRAIFYLGEFMLGVAGGAFVYPNEETLSVGLVVPLDVLIRATTERFEKIGKLMDAFEAFEAHPMVAEILEGARAVEFSAHNTPKGYKTILKRPYADGFLVAGDALGSFVKIGPMADGMRGAIASGMMAAATYSEAKTSGSFRGKNLSRYRDLLSSIYDDVNRSGRDGFVAESSFVYHTLPRLIFKTRVMASTFRFRPRGGPGDHVVKVPPAFIGVSDESHVKVDADLASRSITKPWVPTCPADCFSIHTPKGDFVSFAEIYQLNLNASARKSSGEARAKTLDDVASAQLRFDPASCLSCGTCGVIGPPEMVKFEHEEDGRGVRFKFG